MIMFESGRKFQIWSYSVSHGSLLFRSVKNEKNNTRIDIFFKNVKFINSKTSIEGMVISEIDDLGIMSNYSISNLFLGDRKFAIHSEKWKGLVVAGFFGWKEDDGEYFEKSYFDH